MPNLYLIGTGLLLMVIGAAILGAFGYVASIINASTPPTPIINNVGQTESNLFNTLGWGLIVVGLILLIIGFFSD